MKQLRILLVDDHHVVRLGLRSLLEGEFDLEVVGEAGNAREALQMARQLQPDVILMDIRLPDRSGIEVCRDIKQQYPRIHILMLTSYANDDMVTEAIVAGATGYILKQLSTGELLKAVRAVGEGEAVLDAKVAKQVLNYVKRTQRESSNAAFRDLSTREIQVLKLVTEGKSNIDIANELVLSATTVRKHVSAILSKLGVSNRIEAATYAVRHHIDRYAP